MSNRLFVPPPDASLSYFQKIKQACHKNWERRKLAKDGWGYQIQPGTKWRDGLSESLLAEFEAAMGYAFPPGLRNYYLTMNGLDRPGIDVRGGSEEPIRYGHTYYAYPDDLDQIRATIDWVLDANHVAADDLPAKASRILPVMGHRFLLVDDPKQRVLSMYGDDIIFWANNLGEFLLLEEFPRIYYGDGYERRYDTEGIVFWLR